jgi:biopolymer transport protein ExbB/TolQ
MDVEQVMFDISDALLVPVLVLTIAALAYTLVQFGALIAELARRRGRGRAAVEAAVSGTREKLATGDAVGASVEADRIARSRPMSRALAEIVALAQEPDADARISKQLADFDYSCIRRLERTRILVRMGPALGLMGTLIPLAPALAGLATGDLETLTQNLRVAFSVTVTGLLTGAFAFATSLIRDRLYGQDFSDAEYFAHALLAQAPPPQPVQPAAGTAVVLEKAPAG